MSLGMEKKPSFLRVFFFHLRRTMTWRRTMMALTTDDGFDEPTTGETETSERHLRSKLKNPPSILSFCFLWKVRNKREIEKAIFTNSRKMADGNGSRANKLRIYFLRVFISARVCVCVCVCACAYACVRVCVCDWLDTSFRRKKRKESRKESRKKKRGETREETNVD